MHVLVWVHLLPGVCLSWGLLAASAARATTRVLALICFAHSSKSGEQQVSEACLTSLRNSFGQVRCPRTGEAAPRVSLPAVRRPEASIAEGVAVLPPISLAYHHLPPHLAVS